MSWLEEIPKLLEEREDIINDLGALSYTTNVQFTGGKLGDVHITREESVLASKLRTVAQEHLQDRLNQINLLLGLAEKALEGVMPRGEQDS